MSVPGLPFANTNLVAISVTGRTLTPSGPMIINDGRQRLPGAGAAVTLTGSVNTARFDVYAVQEVDNTYLLLVVPVGTDLSGRRDVRLLGSVIDYPTAGGCTWQPQSGSALDAYLYVDSYGLHVRPVAAGFAGVPTGSLIIDPVPSSVIGSRLWLHNDAAQAIISNYVQGLTDPAQQTQQALFLYSTGYMVVQSDAMYQHYINADGFIYITTALTITAQGAHPQKTIFDNHARVRKTQDQSPGIAVNTGVAGLGATASVTGTDEWGRIQVTTGTSTAGAGGVLATVTYTNPLFTAPYGVQIDPANNNAQNLARNQDVKALNGGLTFQVFALYAGSVALAASTTYMWTYRVLGA